jgi:UDP-N-acetyl-D-glucosamine/UDP-N-acetyl-D-galactosamine dehydrogenase
MNPTALADIRIGVIGLGHVGLPLAVHLARHFPVLGSNISEEPRR